MQSQAELLYCPAQFLFNFFFLTEVLRKKNLNLYLFSAPNIIICIQVQWPKSEGFSFILLNMLVETLEN